MDKTANTKRNPAGKNWIKERWTVDENVQKEIDRIVREMTDSFKPAVIEGLNGFQRKQIHRHFEKTNEFQVKTYKENDNVIMKVFPIGMLRRLAEQKTQEVLMKGKKEALPPMGSFERYIIHDYLKEREGIATESIGDEGNDRHIEIYPVFGRNLRKIKKRLI